MVLLSCCGVAVAPSDLILLLAPRQFEAEVLAFLLCRCPSAVQPTLDVIKHNIGGRQTF